MSKRKQTYIDAAVQGQLVRRILLHWLVFCLVIILVAVFALMALGDVEKTITERVSQSFGQLMLLGIVMISLLPAFMLDTIRFSNRFVGPIARLRSSLRALAQGNSQQTLRFRGNDFWSDAAEEFNNVAARVRQLEAEVQRLQATQDSADPHASMNREQVSS